MALTILEGSTFCVCDEIGDVFGPSGGLFAHDTRFLSRFLLRVNGAAPLLLSSGRVEYFSAAFYLRNPLAGGLAQDALSIARTRFVSRALQDHIVVTNESMDRVTCELSIEVAADFADIITVKQHDFSLGDPAHAAAFPPPAALNLLDNAELVLEEAHGDARTQILLSRPAVVRGDVLVFPVSLAPNERWELRVDVLPLLTGETMQRELVERRFGEERSKVRDSLSVWSMQVPQLRSSWYGLDRSFERSVTDLAALRMRTPAGTTPLPAAGMPWFMAIFGRDTLITSLQTLLFGPQLAIGALEALADLQAHEDDPTIDAEPGKMIHELREGRATATWFARYYGTVDATPLWLILLSEVWRWTDDTELVSRLKEPALAALGWIDGPGDRDGDGFVEYSRRTEKGLLHQSWKDSGTSQRFHDGRFAEPPIACAEVQGYVYDAKLRVAEIARDAWRDRALATRLEQDAARLRQRFDDAFWVPDRGGFYALALDRDKRPVDSRASNMGHLLWSGIVPPHRVDAIVDQLFSAPLWSGWGVRTMSSDDAAYNPLAYHNGTVWPHDNSLIAWGLMRHNRWHEARRLARALFEAAGSFDWSLPEVFAGYPRSETPFPIAYPTAARPQAWAAGTPVLLLRVLLGLEPDRVGHRLKTLVEDRLPSWVGSLRLSGIRAWGRLWDVLVEHGRVRVEEV